jgi:hypothetical protein
MTRRLAGLLAIVILGWTTASARVPCVGQQSGFRARTDAVSVVVSVTRDQRPVLGLDAADFGLTDNGVRQSVTVSSLEQVPIDLTLVLTTYPPDRTSEYRRGLDDADATRRLLRPGDRLRVIRVRDDVLGVVVDPDTAVPAGRETYFMGQALVDGLFYALAWPVPADRRHLVVVFTDGWDTWSTLDVGMLPTLAARADAVLHAAFWASPGDGGSGGGLVGVTSANPSARVAEWRASYDAVVAAAHATGGAVHRTNQPAAALASTVRDFRTSYVLHYTPRGVPLPGWHDLRVQVKRGGSFTIRARKGYEGG